MDGQSLWNSGLSLPCRMIDFSATVIIYRKFCKTVGFEAKIIQNLRFCNFFQETPGFKAKVLENPGYTPIRLFCSKICTVYWYIIKIRDYLFVSFFLNKSYIFYL